MIDVSPRALDVRDAGERAARGMPEQAPRQSRDERLRRDGLRRLSLLDLVDVVEGRAAAVARKVERDEPLEPRGVGNVAPGQVVGGGDAAEPGPVLAEQRSLRRELVRIAVGPHHAVTGREEKRGARLHPGEDVEQRLSRRVGGDEFLLAEIHLRRDGRLRRGEPAGGKAVHQGAHQPVRAEHRRIVERVARREEHRLAGVADRLGGFIGDDAPGIARVLLRRVEIEKTHAVVGVDLVGDVERDSLGRADPQEIVGHPRGLDVVPGHVVPRQPGGRGLAGEIVQLFHARVVAHLAPAVFDERAERLAHRGRIRPGERRCPSRRA